VKHSSKLCGSMWIEDELWLQTVSYVHGLYRGVNANGF